MKEKQGSLDSENVTLPRVVEKQRASMRAFLDAFARLGVVGRAAEEAGIERRTVYRWREDNAEFAELFESAKAAYVELLEEEADRRGRIGWKEPVGWYRGKPGGKVRRFSDALLMFRLKALDDKYRDRLELKGTLAGLDMSRLTDEQVARIAAGEHPLAVLASGGDQAPALLPASTTNAGPVDS